MGSDWGGEKEGKRKKKMVCEVVDDTQLIPVQLAGCFRSGGKMVPFFSPLDTLG